MRLDKESRFIDAFTVEEEMELTEPEQFKALAHPMRHRLLFALGQRAATISQLAGVLQTNKGNVAHHLKVLVAAGLVQPGETRQVRGGTEQYFERAARRLRYTGEHARAAIGMAFQVIAEDIAHADPDPLLVLRHLRLTPEQVERITAVLNELAYETAEADDTHERYGLLLGLFKPISGPVSEAG
jgi:DNA-binding transcriptional ArsR family regulator